MKKRNRININAFQIISLIVLVLYSLSIILLIVWAFFAALKSQNEFRVNILGIPKKWQWSNFAYVFQNFSVGVTTLDGRRLEVGMSMQLVNTLLVVGVGALIAAAVPCIAAYCTAVYKNKVSSLVYAIVIVTMVLPIVGAYPSEIQLLRSLSLYDTIYGNWIQKFNFLGMYFLVYFAVFKNVSKEYFEAARIDGASEFTVCFRIIMPLARSVFFTVVLIKFIEFWNDYQTPLLYLPSHPTIAYGIYSLSNSNKAGLNNVPMRMAGCLMMLVPILVLFIIFKDRIMGNVSMGGIKE